MQDTLFFPLPLSFSTPRSITWDGLSLPTSYNDAILLNTFTWFQEEAEPTLPSDSDLGVDSVKAKQTIGYLDAKPLPEFPNCCLGASSQFMCHLAERQCFLKLPILILWLPFQTPVNGRLAIIHVMQLQCEHGECVYNWIGITVSCQSLHRVQVVLPNVSLGVRELDKISQSYICSRCCMR